MKADGHIPLIAHIIYRLQVGGLENGLVNIINRIPDSRYKHVIICLTDYTDFRDRLNKDVEVIALHKKEGKDLLLNIRLWKILRKLKPDIVHTRNLAAIEAQLPAFLAGVPCRIHGEHGRDVHDLEGKSRKYQWLRKLFRPLIDRFIPLSLELQRYLEDDVGVKPKQIVHICNGVDADKFYPASDRDRSALPAVFADKKYLVIGCVGRLETVKDQSTLANAFVMLINENERLRNVVRLVILGEGTLRGEIERILEDGKCLDISWLPGSRNDVPELMREFDLFVLPSLAEGISNTILEAMATGIPVVATDVGGNNELVLQDKTGFLVPSNNPQAMARAMLHYINDSELRKAHARSARKRIEDHFSIDTMVRKYLHVYDEITSSKGIRKDCSFNNA